MSRNLTPKDKAVRAVLAAGLAANGVVVAVQACEQVQFPALPPDSPAFQVKAVNSTATMYVMMGIGELRGNEPPASAPLVWPQAVTQVIAST